MALDTLTEQELDEVIDDVATELRVPDAAVRAFVENLGIPTGIDDECDLREQFKEAYAGEWSNLGEFAYELASDLRGIEDHWPYSCIDWEYAAEELRVGGDYWYHLGPSYTYYVFRSV